ncbi:MAG: hypothetical protein BACC_03643 [Bacteroides sp.]
MLFLNAKGTMTLKGQLTNSNNNEVYNKSS